LGLCRRGEADILICEIAERFLKRIPDDKFDVRATLAARLREK
jgi:hypothetical protein